MITQLQFHPLVVFNNRLDSQPCSTVSAMLGLASRGHCGDMAVAPFLACSTGFVFPERAAHAHPWSRASLRVITSLRTSTATLDVYKLQVTGSLDLLPATACTYLSELFPRSLANVEQLWLRQLLSFCYLHWAPSILLKQNRTQPWGRTPFALSSLRCFLLTSERGCLVPKHLNCFSSNVTNGKSHRQDY